MAVETERRGQATAVRMRQLRSEMAALQAEAEAEGVADGSEEGEEYTGPRTMSEQGALLGSLVLSGVVHCCGHCRVSSVLSHSFICPTVNSIALKRKGLQTDLVNNVLTSAISRCRSVGPRDHVYMYTFDERFDGACS